MNLLERIVSGGQTGVDQAAWRAARSVGLATDGYMPAGYRTEEGLRPELREIYGARGMASPDYPARTRANVELADATLIVIPQAQSPVSDRGTRLTVQICEKRERPHLVANPPKTSVVAAVSWIRNLKIRTLNVAGPRESSCPGIGQETEEWLAMVFRTIQQGCPPDPEASSAPW